MFSILVFEDMIKFFQINQQDIFSKHCNHKIAYITELIFHCYQIKFIEETMRLYNSMFINFMRSLNIKYIQYDLHYEVLHISFYLN